MPSKYWIKLHQEILEDPKMGRLPDNLWRRAIELFLLAGELGSDLKEDDRGFLPTTGEIAWRLRQPEERLEAELNQLAEIGILTQIENGWLVTNFVKRQKHVTDADRMKQYRERKRSKALQESDASDKDIVTRSVTYRNVEIESDIEIDEPPIVKPSRTRTKPKEPTLPYRILFVTLADLCRINLKAATQKQVGQLDISSKALVKLITDPDQFKAKFPDYWDKVDWRGIKGQAPTPPQIQEVYGDYCHWLENGQSTKNGNKSSPKTLDPDKERIYRELEAARQKE